MNLLLDTHAAIWAMTRRARLSKEVQALIGDPLNMVNVSVVSLWEIAIKFELGRPDSPPFSSEDALGYFADAGYSILPMTAAHAVMVSKLPLLHRDPFDRMLVAQALTEPMRLISHDRRMATYSDTVITW